MYVVTSYRCKQILEIRHHEIGWISCLLMWTLVGNLLPSTCEKSYVDHPFKKKIQVILKLKTYVSMFIILAINKINIVPFFLNMAENQDRVYCGKFFIFLCYSIAFLIKINEINKKKNPHALLQNKS